MKLLVLGCGSIGGRHAGNARDLVEVALFDSDAAKAAALARKFDLRAFTDLSAAWDWGPDATIVAVPNHLHLDRAAEALQAGSHVLIEKPISHSLEGVPALLARAERTRRKVFVGCNMRFHAGPATLRKALGEIGKPMFARAHFGNYLPAMRPGADYRTLYCARRETGGGTILDSIHELDYLAWLLGPVSEVTCSAARLGDLDIEVEDYAAITLRHAGETRSEVHLDYLQRVKRRGCEIVGSEGTLLWSSDGKAPERCTVALFRAADQCWEQLFTSDDLDANDAYRDMLRAFFSAIVSNRDDGHLLDGRNALNDLSVALAALEAAETKSTCTVEWLS